MNAHPIRQMLAERQTKRDRLEREIITIDAEIRVLNEAVRRMGLLAHQQDTLISARAGGEAGEAAMPNRSGGASPQGGRDGRALHPTWGKVLRFIGSAEAASLDDIMEFSKREGLGIERNTLRSQTSVYGKRGWLERTGQGTFRLTADGAAKCGFNPIPQNETSDEADQNPVQSIADGSSLNDEAHDEGGPDDVNPQASLGGADSPSLPQFLR